MLCVVLFDPDEIAKRLSNEIAHLAVIVERRLPRELAARGHVNCADDKRASVPALAQNHVRHRLPRYKEICVVGTHDVYS
jgi:hypothetical protein